jgi:hypothetical protein
MPYLAMLPDISSCFDLILDRGGGGRHCQDVFSKVEVGSAVVSVALLIIKMKDPVVTPSTKPGAASDGTNRFSFLHENCEKLKRFAPSKTKS